MHGPQWPDATSTTRVPCGIRFKLASRTPDNQRELGPRCTWRVSRLAVCTACPLPARWGLRIGSSTGRPGSSFRPSGHFLPGITVVEDLSQKLLQARLVDETALVKAAQ